METHQLPPGGLDALMKEHALLREEVKDRLKTAFSHVAYAGAVAAFAIPAAEKTPDWVPHWVPFATAGLGFVGLLWVAFLNMRWVQHLGAYIHKIEEDVERHFGAPVIGWEHYAEGVRANMWALIPKAPELVALRRNLVGRRSSGARARDDA